MGRLDFWIIIALNLHFSSALSVLHFQFIIHSIKSLTFSSFMSLWASAVNCYYNDPAKFTDSTHTLSTHNLDANGYTHHTNHLSLSLSLSLLF